MNNSPRQSLSALEYRLLQIVWDAQSCSAEHVREVLKGKKSLKDSTVRTVLRRLEEKGFVTHKVEGRTYIYSPLVAPGNAAARAVRQIIDRFCGGSIESLLVGMIADRVLSKQELKELAEKIEKDDTRE